MIPHVGIAEMLVLAIIALVVVGPKDLPVMMRKAGQFVGKIKKMGQEFKDSFTEMGEDAELADLKREIEELKSMRQMSNLSDEAFEEDMRALDRDINAGFDMSERMPPQPKSKSKSKLKKIATKPAKKPTKKTDKKANNDG
ncbi:MAG: Sec-independent protein translocase protein TatB [Robiginitomaculum sp.]